MNRRGDWANAAKTKGGVNGFGRIGGQVLKPVGDFRQDGLEVVRITEAIMTCSAKGRVVRLKRKACP